MNRLSSLYKALLLFLITAFFSTQLRAQCSIQVTGAKEGCVPFTAQFKFVYTGSKTVASGGYSWDFGDSKTGTDPITTSHIFLKAGCYNTTVTVTFTDGTTCSATYSPCIKVYDLPTAVPVLPSGPNGTVQCYKSNGVKNKFCFQDNSTKSADNNDIVKWRWNFGDGNTDSNQNPCHSYDSFGVYSITLTVIDSKGCTGTKTQKFAIQVLKDITINFAANGKQSCDSAAYNFNNTSDTNGIWISSFVWDFGDPFYKLANNNPNVDSTNWSPKHKYKKPGKYSVKLTITNKLGCKASATKVITVDSSKLHIVFKDTVCWKGNDVKFTATEINGASFWSWNFGDPPSGNKNVANFQWATDHAFTSPKVFNVRFTVQHPVCGTRDTCFKVHIVGPQAAILLPPPPAFPLNDTVPPKPMPLSVFSKINALYSGDVCSNTKVTYSIFIKGSKKSYYKYKYCNAKIIKRDTAVVINCAGKKYADTVRYIDAVTLKPTDSVKITYTDSTEATITWTKGSPIPTRPYYPSKGKLVWETMNDSNKTTCILPNLVRFTNQSLKFRLYNAIDDNPNNNVGGNGFKDTCKYKNYPFASDSMIYFWKFNDPNGKPCTSSVSLQDWNCNFSTLCTPYHLYKGPKPPDTRCQTVNLSVKDPVTGCADSMVMMLKQGPPQAWWDRGSGGYCKMNWDIQQILPPGQAGTPGKPLRGFRFTQQPTPCTGSNYPFNLDFSETLPSCGADNWWATFDSAGTTKIACSYKDAKGKTVNVYDYGFLGANNKKGYPAGAPKKVWTGLPWLNHYWYDQGDSGCKTVGIVIQNGTCYDTAWYHNYICFNKLNPDFDISRVDSFANSTTGKMDAFINVIGTSIQGVGFTCHSAGNPLNKAGITVKLSAHDKNQSGINNWKYQVTRRQFPPNDPYYNQPMWPDTAVLYYIPVSDSLTDTTSNWNSATDSITSFKDTLIVPGDSMLSTDLLNNSGTKIGDIILSNVHISYKNWLDIVKNGKTTIDPNDPVARLVNVSCSGKPVVLNKYFGNTRPLTIKQTIHTLLLADKFKADSKKVPGTKRTYMHDTVTFHIPYPGFYTFENRASNVDNCLSGAVFHLIYGHFAKFSVRGGDSIICVGDTVTFDYTVLYWTTLCPPGPGSPPPDGCVNGFVGNWAPLFTPWNQKLKPSDYRTNLNPRYVKPTTGYTEEDILWNFGDNTSFYNIRLSGKAPFHQYQKAGVYDVTMRTTDSVGCTINTTRHKLIKVIGVAADFSTLKASDTLTICAPKAITYKDLSVMLGSSINKPGKFGYKDKVVKKNKIVDTTYILDSIITWRWDPGDGRAPVTRTSTDTAQFVYLKDGYYTVSLAVTSANKPKGCTDKKIRYKYVHVYGPEPNFKFAQDSSGCAPLTVKIRNLNFKGYHYQWDLGDGTVVNSGKNDSIITLRYIYPNNRNGKGPYYTIRVTEQDSIFDIVTKKYVTCSTTWPDTQANRQYNVVVFPNGPVKLTGDTFICPKHTANFSVKQDGEYKHFIWNFGDGTVIASNSGTASHVYNYAGPTRKYKVTVNCKTDTFCTNVDTMTIYVDSLQANFVVDTANKDKGLFRFINTSKAYPKTGIEYTWDFGNGQTKVVSDTQAVVYDYGHNVTDKNQTEGRSEVKKFTYNVCLSLYRKASDCPSKKCDTVEFKRGWEHFNVLTPDGDGKNDLFAPYVDGELSYHIEIFNRWGEKVFTSDSKNNAWDGNNQKTGSACPEGEYYYVWTFKLLGGYEKTLPGSVTLIRNK